MNKILNEMAIVLARKQAREELNEIAKELELLRKEGQMARAVVQELLIEKCYTKKSSYKKSKSLK